MNELENLISYVGDSVLDVISEEFDRSSQSFFDDQPITDDTDLEFREHFENEYSFESWIDMLKNNQHFKEDFMALLDYVIKNRDTTK